jgi:hypothetical protein
MNESPRYRPERDARVTDVLRYLYDRRNEAERMIAFWERSQKPYAAEELFSWRAVLRDVTSKIERLSAPHEQPEGQRRDARSDE